MNLRATIVGFAAALLAAGCGGSANQGSDAASPQASQQNKPAETAQTQATWTSLTRPASDPDPVDTGNFTVVYQDAQSPEAVHGRQLMMDAKLIEGVTQNINDILALPKDVPVNGKQCGEANAYWSPSDQEMQLCYEYLDTNYKLFADSGDPDPATSTVNAEIATFYHELGHATIDLYNLAFTGREEDVADQLSAVILLAPGKDGKPDPDGVKIATDRGRLYKVRAAASGAPNEEDAADVHSFDLQRMYNYECWIDGSDPAAGAQIVADGLLPQERADGCKGEFDKMTAAWEQMLGPHFK